jgi:hypothetical protein
VVWCGVLCCVVLFVVWCSVLCGVLWCGVVCCVLCDVVCCVVCCVVRGCVVVVIYFLLPSISIQIAHTKWIPTHQFPLKLDHDKRRKTITKTKFVGGLKWPQLEQYLVLDLQISHLSITHSLYTRLHCSHIHQEEHDSTTTIKSRRVVIEILKLRSLFRTQNSKRQFHHQSSESERK